MERQNWTLEEWKRTDESTFERGGGGGGRPCRRCWRQRGVFKAFNSQYISVMI